MYMQLFLSHLNIVHISLILSRHKIQMAFHSMSQCANASYSETAVNARHDGLSDNGIFDSGKQEANEL